MDRYVVGFAYSKNMDTVLLIRKLRPEWQAGCLNGIGGKIEGEESPLEAMEREGLEESGLVLAWQHKGVMIGTNNDERQFECHIFYAYSDAIYSFNQAEDEPLSLYPLSIIRKDKIIKNLSFLVPYGVCGDHSEFITINY